MPLLALLRATATAISRSLRHTGPLVLGLLALACIVMSVGAWRGHTRYDNVLHFFEDVILPKDRWAGAFTIVSAVALIGAGAFFLLVGRQIALVRRLAPERTRVAPVWWYLAGAGMVYLGFDESLAIHENLSYRLETAGAPKLLGIDQDLYIFAVYGALALIVGWNLRDTVIAHSRVCLPLVLAGALFGISQCMDFLPWLELTPGQQLVVGPIEEIGKVMGSISSALYGALLLEDVVESRVRAVSATPMPLRPSRD